MADEPTTTQMAEPLVYRPISGLALVGFVLSSLFAALVSLSTVVALVQGLPVYLPAWAMVFAAAGAVICFLAQWRIRNAEGTLAGMALARWGLGLSVILGATYLVYTKVTGWALAKQANDFLMVIADEDTGFFPRLKNASKNRTELNQAFLLTLPTTSRGGSRASNEKAMLAQFDQPGNDGEPGNISAFSKKTLVLALMKNAETIKIEPLSVLDWKYEGNCYHVVRNYRFTTPELEIEIPITVQSTEGALEGEQRKWFVNMTKMPRITSVKPTPVGEKLLAFRYYSKLFVDKWLESWRSKQIEGPPAPEYKDMDTDWPKILPTKELQREHIRKRLVEVFRGERKAPEQMKFATDDYFADLTTVGGHIQVSHPFKLILPAGDGFPNFNVELEFVVATKDPVDLAAKIKLPLPWEIVKIHVIRAAVAPKISGPT